MARKALLHFASTNERPLGPAGPSQWKTTRLKKTTESKVRLLGFIRDQMTQKVNILHFYSMQKRNLQRGIIFNRLSKNNVYNNYSTKGHFYQKRQIGQNCNSSRSWCRLINCLGVCRFHKYSPPLSSKYSKSTFCQVCVGFINTHLHQVLFQVLLINLQLINFLDHSSSINCSFDQSVYSQF